MEKIICKKCQKENSPDSLFCDSCGTKISKGLEIIQEGEKSTNLIPLLVIFFLVFATLIFLFVTTLPGRSIKFNPHLYGFDAKIISPAHISDEIRLPYSPGALVMGKMGIILLSNSRIALYNIAKKSTIWEKSIEVTDENIKNIIYIGGKIFFASNDSVICLTERDGETLWSYNTYTPIIRLISSGKKIILQTNEKLIALNKTNAELNWEFNFKNEGINEIKDLESYGNHLLFSAIQRKNYESESETNFLVICLNTNDGSEKWRDTTKDYNSKLLIGERGIYFMFNENSLSAYNIINNSKKYEISLANLFNVEKDNIRSQSYIVSDNQFFISLELLKNYYIANIDLNAKKLKWLFPYPYTTMFADKNSIIGIVNLGDSAYYLTGLKKDNGKILWSYILPKDFYPFYLFKNLILTTNYSNSPDIKILSNKRKGQVLPNATKSFLDKLENFLLNNCQNTLSQNYEQLARLLNNKDFVETSSEITDFEELKESALTFSQETEELIFAECPKNPLERNLYKFNPQIIELSSKIIKDAFEINSDEVRKVFKEFSRKLPVFYDAELESHKKGGNVVYADGTVEFLPAKEFRKIQPLAEEKLSELISNINSTAIEVYLKNLCNGEIKKSREIDLNSDGIQERIISCNCEQTQDDVEICDHIIVGLKEGFLNIYANLRGTNLSILNSITSDYKDIRVTLYDYSYGIIERKMVWSPDYNRYEFLTEQ